MLNAIIRSSLRYRTLVLAVCLVVLVYGGYLTTTLPIDVFPDLDRPRVVILTECPGLAPDEVESRVAHPIETAILGANGVEAVRGQCTAGLAVIYVEFGWQVDVRVARQTVQERLATVAGQLPPGVRPMSQGFLVAPNVSDSVNGQIHNSGTDVLPRITAPASRSLRTTSASCCLAGPWALVPIVVTSPATSTSSLIAIGTPSSGSRSPASSRCWATVASARAESSSTTR